MWAGLVAQEIRNNAGTGVAQHLNASTLILWVRVNESHVDGTDAPLNHRLGA
jgi:hypothetical protein